MGQVEELKAAIEERGDPPVTLIGHSWGAMPSYIFAAHHPALCRRLIMVGSAVFDPDSAALIMPTRLERLTPEEGEQLVASKDFGLVRHLLHRADSYDPLPMPDSEEPFDAGLHQSVWGEADELRRRGDLLTLGTKITCPVIAIHGDYDPHPVAGVADPLRTVLSDFELIVIPHCGHTPWLERQARDRFYEILRGEIV